MNIGPLGRKAKYRKPGDEVIRERHFIEPSLKKYPIMYVTDPATLEYRFNAGGDTQLIFDYNSIEDELAIIAWFRKTLPNTSLSIINSIIHQNYRKYMKIDKSKIRLLASPPQTQQNATAQPHPAVNQLEEDVQDPEDNNEAYIDDGDEDDDE